MQCREFEHRLNVVLDQRGNPLADSQLASHVCECEQCRDLLAAQEALFTGLRSFSLPLLASDFGERVVLEVTQTWSNLSPSLNASEDPQRPSSSSRRDAIVITPSPRRLLLLAAGGSLAAAAIVALAVSLAWHARDMATPDVSPRGGTIGGSYQAKSGRMRRHALAIARPGQRMKYDAAWDNPALTGKAWLIEAPRLSEHVLGYRDAFASLAEALPETEQHLDQMEQVAPGLRPIRRSLAVLWDTLWQALPIGGSSEEPRTENGYPKV